MYGDLIDNCIWDRKHGEVYTAQSFYSRMIDYENEDIIRAFETKDESKIREALCNHISRWGHPNIEIIDFINSVEWAGDIKPIEWKEYWYARWNNFTGDGWVDSCFVKINGRSKTQIEKDMRRKLFEDYEDADDALEALRVKFND